LELHLNMNKSEARKRAVQLLEMVGIPGAEARLDDYPHQFSGGMRQRVMIAMGLSCDPQLLIADEPTTALDVTIQAQILELLKQLKQKEISSVLLITHDLGIVAETCDRVGVMYAGNLCEVADIKDLFRSPKHPYTQALLSAVPRLSQEGALQSIEGSVPNLVTPPPGCRFHPRCRQAMAVCREKFPEMVEIQKNHQVACYWAASQK